MPVQVKLDDIIEALEMVGDESQSYLDRETGEVHFLTDEEFDLAEDSETPSHRIPEWQREPIEMVRRIEKDQSGRYVPLPIKFDVHEWAIMDRFALSIEDRDTSADFRGSIRGAGAFRMFKRLLTEYNLWDPWNKFRHGELRQMAIDWCEENGIAYRET